MKECVMFFGYMTLTVLVVIVLFALPIIGASSFGVGVAWAFLGKSPLWFPFVLSGGCFIMFLALKFILHEYIG